LIIIPGKSYPYYSKKLKKASLSFVPVLLDVSAVYSKAMDEYLLLA